MLQKACGRGGLTYNDPKLKGDGDFYFIQGKTAVHTNGHTSKHNTISYGKGLSAGHLLENTISPVAGNNVHTIGVKIQKVEG